MLVLLSPAKTLDYNSTNYCSAFSIPLLLDDSEQLIQSCQMLTIEQIAKLMKVSDNIAKVNAERFVSWQKSLFDENDMEQKLKQIRLRQAIFAFKGDAYIGFDADTLSQADLDYAQTHLRILSGLYGLLKPLDCMLPYRLEMGCKLNNVRGSHLYQFWGDRITQQLNQALLEQRELDSSVIQPIVVNLASNEYFKAVKIDKLSARVITPIFKDQKAQQYKVISFFAKKARGMMARYIIEQRIETIEQLAQFNVDGYCYCAIESDAQEMVFKRTEDWAMSN